MLERWRGMMGRLYFRDAFDQSFSRLFTSYFSHPKSDLQIDIPKLSHRRLTLVKRVFLRFLGIWSSVFVVRDTNRAWLSRVERNVERRATLSAER